MMSPSEKTAAAQEEPRIEGVYVYGIVPADVTTEEDAVGVADSPVSVVSHGDIAALVSEISLGRPLGKPADLRAHAHLLDGTAKVAPVLPMRFGAVLTGVDAVKDELLAENAEDFSTAMAELEGKAEYLLKARYVEETLLREVIEENAQARELLEVIRSQPEEVTRDARIGLGEIVAKSIEVKRDADTRAAVDALVSLTDAVSALEPTHEEDAANVAILLETARQEDLEHIVGELGEQWDGRVEVRLLGPLAAYDFVMTRTPEG